LKEIAFQPVYDAKSMEGLERSTDIYSYL
jgi:hypothetical protein